MSGAPGGVITSPIISHIMVSLITEKLRKQLLEDDGAKMEKPSKLQHEIENRPVILAQRHQLSSAAHSYFLDALSQPSGNTCQCSSREMDQTAVRPSQQSDKSISECGKCQLCLLSTDVSLNQTKKRQCHMMSSPDECDQSPWQHGWQPLETSVWRPVGTDQSRHAVLGCRGRPEPAVTLSNREWNHNREPHRRSSDSSESPSPILRPSSGLSGFFENFCNPLNAVAQCSGSPFSPSLSAFSLTGLSLEEIQQSIQNAPGSAGSMPAIACEDIICGSLLQCQPQRCRSQPSVLPEQRGFKKRRYDEKRPNLNFIKMKETAYSKRHQSHNRARNIVQFGENTNQLQATKCENIDQSRFFYSLDTIASSPQELASCPGPVSPSGEHPAPKSGSQIHTHDLSTYRESLDSGCSGDFVLCLESESSSDSRCKQLNKGIEEEVFDLDALDDLDVDEIENG